MEKSYVLISIYNFLNKKELRVEKVLEVLIYQTSLLLYVYQIRYLLSRHLITLLQVYAAGRARPHSIERPDFSAYCSEKGLLAFPSLAVFLVCCE